ncbi:MAG: leucine--tRNA ligase [Firmicutes bacterium]|nr:leucine--tRNA ligase [Bacillota bacterium]
MNYTEVHKKWQKYWNEHDTNKFDPKSKRPAYYHLDMFPYPSAANLHMGHYFHYAPSDTHARFMRMTGHNVFHPMGYDSFGLPSENHALKTNTHPGPNTTTNVERFTRQLNELGGMYDWNYSLTTSEPDYYKWTQWLFLQLHKHGLAYQKEAAVNWCSGCQTVLANEQSQDGKCERCNAEVVRMNKNQWFFRITDFADELLTDLDKIDWPAKTRAMQTNWIGKSDGARITFDGIDVFTTRIDTINSVTFLVLSPEHPFVDKLTTKEQSRAVAEYKKMAAKKSEIERMENHEKTGVFTGHYVTNPYNGDRVPLWVADYVIYGYGTGAVMGVPGYDERDREFAEKYNIQILENEFVPVAATIKKLGKSARTETTYRLRDWSIGRQRYWGSPIPIIYCDKCGVVPVPEHQLPVMLPHLDDFKPRGAPPLANDPNFVKTTCPICKIPAKRETETMDTFVCSSWYFLRYPTVGNDKIAFDKTTARQIDTYVGGAEHACGHLLQARFITKFLHKHGYINFNEPAKKLVHQGMILASDGQKMSKSKGNTIAPDNYVAEFGSDILRLYMLFGFNYTDGGPWSEGTLKTMPRFIERVIRAVEQINCEMETDPEVQHIRATTIAAVRTDMQDFSFNTAVARCMELLNAISAAKGKSRESIRDLILCLAPMIPHIAEELWDMAKLPRKTGESIFNMAFPTADPNHLERAMVEYVVQVNSKKRGTITVSKDATQKDVEAAAQKLLDGTTPKKTVYVPGRLINFIV